MLQSTNSEGRGTDFEVHFQNVSLRMKNIFIFYNF